MTRVVALAGGVGGAKLADGLQAHIGEALTVVVNTGDDCWRHGLLVMPDHDTVLYNLAGIEQVEWGWGIEGDTRVVMDQLGVYGEETWFTLGDRDLALHIARTARVRAGGRVTDACLDAQEALGISARILPMTDDRVRTFVHTNAGRLAFQDYLVRRRARGRVRRIELAGARRAKAAPGVLAALRSSDVIVIAPSNPLVSVEPILAVQGVRDVLRRRRAHVVAVTPLVAGRPLKGPLHRMLRGLGLEVSPRGVARRYAGVAGTFVLDERDRAWRPAVEALGLRVVVTDTVMRTRAHAARLAAATLAAVEPART